MIIRRNSVELLLHELDPFVVVAESTRMRWELASAFVRGNIYGRSVVLTHTEFAEVLWWVHHMRYSELRAVTRAGHSDLDTWFRKRCTEARDRVLSVCTYVDRRSQREAVYHPDASCFARFCLGLMTMWKNVGPQANHDQASLPEFRAEVGRLYPT
jgi:hypothetical protein